MHEKYTKLEIIELMDEGTTDTNKAIKLEGEKILKHLNQKDYIITLEIEGKKMNSLELSKKIDYLLANRKMPDYRKETPDYSKPVEEPKVEVKSEFNPVIVFDDENDETKEEK